MTRLGQLCPDHTMPNFRGRQGGADDDPAARLGPPDQGRCHPNETRKASTSNRARGSSAPSTMLFIT